MLCFVYDEQALLLLVEGEGIGHPEEAWLRCSCRFLQRVEVDTCMQRWVYAVD
jgi:hypothetical protein